jgi:ADP-ribose pyrophosphatase YjhB (NUDIX family)
MLQEQSAVKRMAAGAVLKNSAGEVLLVKPTYKSTWEIPGGMVEAGESPLRCCERELAEELGLELRVTRLLVVDWVPPRPDRSDALMFLFDGGVVGAESIGRIVLAEGELSAWRFVPVRQLTGYLTPEQVRRMKFAAGKAHSPEPAYLEHGFETAEAEVVR